MGLAIQESTMTITLAGGEVIKCTLAQLRALPDLLEALRSIEMETRQGAQWTTPEINAVARAAIFKAESTN